MLLFLGFFLVLFFLWSKSNFFNPTSKSELFFAIFDIFCRLSHFFEPIFMQRLDQNLNSDFFIFIQIRKGRQNTIHRICFKSLIGLERINTLFGQSKLTSCKILPCLQKLWLLNMGNNRPRIKRSNHLLNRYNMISRYSKDKFDHFLFYQDLHTNRIISKFFISPTSIKNRIKIFINLIHQFDILFH